MSRVRILFLGWVMAASGLGCSEEVVATSTPDEGSSPDAGAKTDAGFVKEPVRSSCGNLPILDDRFKDTSDSCKECFDNRCCAAAEACAGDSICKELWECRARCTSLFDSCVPACSAAAGQPLPTANGPVVSCRNACEDCIDVKTCSEGPWPAPPEATYPVEIHFRNFTSLVPFPGATIKVCRMEDTECAEPLSEVTTDATGKADAEIPAAPDFTSAYFDLSGPNVGPTLAFTRGYHATEKLQGGLLVLYALDSATTGALLGSIGSKGDQTKVGAITGFALSCGDRGVRGLTGASSGSDDATIRTYLVSGVPVASATQTDAGGSVSFVDHPPGPTTITMTDSLGKVFGSADGFVRAGTLSAIYVLPAH